MTIVSSYKYYYTYIEFHTFIHLLIFFIHLLIKVQQINDNQNICKLYERDVENEMSVRYIER